MKKLLLLTAAIAISFITNAQVSQATMTAQIKGDDNSVISVEYSGNGKAENEYADGAWHNYFYQNYKTISSTKYPGITYVYRGVIRYEDNRFQQYLIGDSWYEGVPDPDKDELLAILKGDLKSFLKDFNYNNTVGEISEITFVEGEEFRWTKLTQLQVKLQVTITTIETSTKLEKATHTYEVYFYSDEYQGPWKEGFYSSYQKKDKVLIETLTYTAEEVAAMKTLSMIDEENAAAKELASLPKIEVPIFQSAKQLFYYTHNIIMTKERDEIFAYFYAVADPKECFVKGSSVLMTDDTKKWVNYVLDNLDAYRLAHCEYPSIAKESDYHIRFYDRKNSRMLDMSGEKPEDTWKLTEVGFAAPRVDEYDGLRGNDENCQGAPDLSYRERNYYEVGDKLTATFSNGDYNGTVDMADQSRNRYQIILVNDKPGKKYWVEEENLKPGHVGKNIGESSSSNNITDENKEEQTSSENATASFKVGDKVIVKTTSGDKKGKIIKYASNKYLVKFNDPRLGDTWCAPTNLTHQ
jgi:hypothetical protein